MKLRPDVLDKLGVLELAKKVGKIEEPKEAV
jgi:hypothetical protein